MRQKVVHAAALLFSYHKHEEIWCMLKLLQAEKKQEPLIVRSLYRTPSATSEHQMEEILKTLDSVKTNGIIWIDGDINLPDINRKD